MTRHLTGDCLFQENKSYGSKNHLHSSSDAQRVMSGTVTLPTTAHDFITIRWTVPARPA
jgi:hypothetical protein